MGIIEQSANAAEVLQSSPLVMFRIGLAQQRLRQDIRIELMRACAKSDDATIQKVIDGLPEDVLYRELAART